MDEILFVATLTASDDSEWGRISGLFRVLWFGSTRGGQPRQFRVLQNRSDWPDEDILEDGWCITYEHLCGISIRYLRNWGRSGYKLQSIPIPWELQVSPDELASETTQHSNAKASSRRALANCLNAIDTLTSLREWDFGPWTVPEDRLGSCGATKTSLGFLPGQTCRMSRRWPSSSSTIQSPEPGEFANVVGTLIAKVLGESSRYLTSISIDHSDGALSVRTGEFPLVVIVSNGKPDNPHAASAEEMMPQSMQKTMLLFLEHYYHSHGWDYDHELTKEAKKAPMDRRLFTFGIYISEVWFSVHSIIAQARPENKVSKSADGPPIPWLFANHMEICWNWRRRRSWNER